jgi:hypothetical protein
VHWNRTNHMHSHISISHVSVQHCKRQTFHLFCHDDLSKSALLFRWKYMFGSPKKNVMVNIIIAWTLAIPARF